MFKEPNAYDAVGFCLTGLHHPSLLHQGKLPLCMRYLRKAGMDFIADAGIWRLWEGPQPVPRASEDHAEDMQVDDDIKRIGGNLDETLEHRVQGMDDLPNRP